MNPEEKLRLLPHEPGVYRFLDSEGTVIYVGKAKDLRRRVSSYFRPKETLTRKTAIMVSRIDDILHTVVSSEEDAFLLENNLIKQFQPKYNILLKDSKTYPWICLRNEPFPRVFVTRRVLKDKSLYFGPYSSAFHARNIVELVESLYRLRTCKLALTEESIAEGKYKVCLNFHLGKCGGPCAGHITCQEYDSQIEEVKDILKGESACLIREYEKKMKKASEEWKFEEAQIWKNRKDLLEKHYSKSLIVSATLLNADVFSIVWDGDDAYGNFLRVHGGCIIQSVNMEIRARIEEEEASVLSSFIAGIYDRFGGMQKEILVPFLPADTFQGAEIHVPCKGDKAALLELSRKNASAMKFEKLKQEEFKNPEEHSEHIVENMMRDLQMEVMPRHIECFDNSNIQGTNPVASCVVFRNGAPSKKDYRHFNIKTVIGPDDFSSMKEVLNRRYTRLMEEGEELPQLVVVDGGKGQVSAAYEVFEELGILEKVKLIGLAKRMEEVIVPGDPYPLFLDRNSTTLRVLMHIRDEAHRFGITHHRNRRSAGQTKSILDDIPGIGKVKKETLLKRFRTISKIKAATEEELISLIGAGAAAALREKLGQSDTVNNS